MIRTMSTSVVDPPRTVHGEPRNPPVPRVRKAPNGSSTTAIWGVKRLSGKTENENSGPKWLVRKSDFVVFLGVKLCLTARSFFNNLSV